MHAARFDLEILALLERMKVQLLPTREVSLAVIKLQEAFFWLSAYAATDADAKVSSLTPRE